MNDRGKEDESLHLSQMGASGSNAELGANSAIGKRLKAFYDDFASEPVPDRFLSLLDALDAAESASKRTERT